MQAESSHNNTKTNKQPTRNAPHGYRTHGDKYLQQHSTVNVQALITHIFNLPSTENASAVGRIVDLPVETTILPREKSVPKPKAPTKWEQFAKTKGIQNRKRDRLVYDERTKDWAPRYGYKRANDESKDWVREHNPNDDPEIDPWTKMKQDKKERVAKNKKQQQKNINVAAGKRRLPGAVDLTSVVGKSQSRTAGKQKPTHHVDVALRMSQHSTASMGRFDEERKREPSRKASQRYAAQPESNKRSSNTHVGVREEKQASLAMLDQLLGKRKSGDVDIDRAVGSQKKKRQR
jgi:regulator of ribosome biosynthesis